MRILTFIGSWGIFLGAGMYSNTLIAQDTQCHYKEPQSPINISDTESVYAHPIKLAYAVTSLDFEHGETGLILHYTNGSNMQVGGKKYTLKKIIFKTPSEHQILSKTFQMEIQFFHQNTTGQTAIISNLVEVKDENTALSELLRYVPIEKTQKNKRSDVFFNARDLLPFNLSYFRYAGTTAKENCFESASWYVLKDPIHASAEQIMAITGLQGENTHPLVPRGHRIILDTQVR